MSFLRRNKSSSSSPSALGTPPPPRPADQLQHAATSPGSVPSAIPVPSKSPRLSLRSRSSLRAALPMQTGPAAVPEDAAEVTGEQSLASPRKRRTSLKNLFRRSSGGVPAAGATSTPASPATSSSSGRGNPPPSTPPSTGRSAPLSSISARTAAISSPSPAAVDGSPDGSLRRKRVGSTPGEGAEVPLYLRRASQTSASATPTSTPPLGTPSTGYLPEKTTPPQPPFHHADRPRAASIASTTVSGGSAAAPGSGHLASHAEQATTALADATARGTPIDFAHGRSPSAHALLQQTIARASPPGSPTAPSGIAVRRRSTAAGGSTSTAHAPPLGTAPPDAGRQPASQTNAMPDGPPRALASRRDTFGESSATRPSPPGTLTGLGPVLVAPSINKSQPATPLAVEGEMNPTFRFGTPTRSRPSHAQSPSYSEQGASASPSRIARPMSTSRRETDTTAATSAGGSSINAGGLAIPRSTAVQPIESHPVRSPQPGEPTKDSVCSAAQAAATPAWWTPGPLPPTRAEVAAFPVPPPTPPASSTAEGDVFQRQQRQNDVAPPVRPTPSPTPSFGALESDALRAEAGALDRIADERPTFLDLPHGLRRPAQGVDDLFATSPPRALDRALPDEDEDDGLAAVGLGSGFSSDGDHDELRDAAPDLPSWPGQVHLSLPSPPLGSQEQEQKDEADGEDEPVATTHALPPTPTLPGPGNGTRSRSSTVSPSVSGSPSRRTSSYPSPSSTASSVRGGGGDGLVPSAMTAVRAPGAASPVPYHLPARKQSHQYTRSELSELEASGTLPTVGGRLASTAAAGPSVGDIFGLGAPPAASASSQQRPTSIAEDSLAAESSATVGWSEPSERLGADGPLEASTPTAGSEANGTVDHCSNRPQTPTTVPTLSEPPVETRQAVSVTESVSAATPSTISSAAFDDDDDDGNASDGLLAPFDPTGRRAATGGISPAASEELSSPVQILEAIRLARAPASPVVSRVSSRAPSPARSTPDRTGGAHAAMTDGLRVTSSASPTPEDSQAGPEIDKNRDVGDEGDPVPDSPPIDPPAPMSFFPSSATTSDAARPATATRVRSSRRPPSPTTSSSSSSTPTPSPATESHERSRPILSVTSPLPRLVPYAPVPWGILPAGLRELAEAPELELRREDVVRAADGAARVVGAGLTVAKWGVGWWAIIPYRTGKWALGK